MRSVIVLACLSARLVCQVVDLDTTVLPKTRCDIRVVDAFGNNIESAIIVIDGETLARGPAGWYEIARGRRQVRVSAQGFETHEGVASVQGQYSLLVFCLRLGTLWDRAPHRVNLEVSGSREALNECNLLAVLPLYCAACRSATFHPLLGGKYVFDDLEPGKYVFTIMSQTRECAVSVVSVPLESGRQIRIGIPR